MELNLSHSKLYSAHIILCFFIPQSNAFYTLVDRLDSLKNNSDHILPCSEISIGSRELTKQSPKSWDLSSLVSALPTSLYSCPSRLTYISAELNCGFLGAFLWGFPGGSVVKNPSAMQETQVWSLGQEDPLEEEMRIHSSSCLENPMDRGAWQEPIVHGVAKELDTTS